MDHTDSAVMHGAATEGEMSENVEQRPERVEVTRGRGAH